MRKGLDAYKQAYDEGRMAKIVGDSGYPPSLKIMVEGVVDVKSPDKLKIFFLRRVPADPMAIDATIPPEQTWGLRSYQSEADAPEEGRDVFDVYSKSGGVGLNGVPYRQW
jgi:general secretion pathway protein G